VKLACPKCARTYFREEASGLRLCPCGASVDANPVDEAKEAWKIRATEDTPEGAFKTVYLQGTLQDAKAIAEVLENLWRMEVASPALRSGILTRILPWNPDAHDVDSDEAVSLENVILWALGR